MNASARSQSVISRLGTLVPQGGECTVTSTSFCREAAHAFARKLVGEDDLDVAVDAIGGFIEHLFNIRGVEAVAFLGVNETYCPTTLSIRVFAPLEEDSHEAGDIIDAVTDAAANLKGGLSRFLPTGLRFCPYGGHKSGVR